MFGIRRREFIRLVGSVAAVWSFAAWAQQAANIHKVGFLSPAGPSFYLPAFFDALAELDEGKNVVVEQRYADNRLERLPGLAEELVTSTSSLQTARATRGQAGHLDHSNRDDSGRRPVGQRARRCLARPGGNVTGMSLMVPDIGGKHLELKELLPRLSRVAVL